MFIYGVTHRAVRSVQPDLHNGAPHASGFCLLSHTASPLAQYPSAVEFNRASHGRRDVTESEGTARCPSLFYFSQVARVSRSNGNSPQNRMEIIPCNSSKIHRLYNNWETTQTAQLSISLCWKTIHDIDI